jgi:teichuronic acid biosynthesis glycosyltransferase TuaG
LAEPIIEDDGKNIGPAALLAKQGMILMATEQRLDLTVVISHYHQPHLLERAIRSVFLQQPLPTQILVVDDHSPDPPNLRSWERNDYLTLTLLRTPNCSGGPATPRNLGIAEATGRHVAFLDADDAWLPGTTAAMAAVWANNPEVLVHGDQLVWGPQLRWPFLQEGLPSQNSAAATHRALIRGGNRVFLSTLAAPRAVLSDSPFDPSQRWEDFDLWLRLTKNGHCFRHTGAVHTLYRLSPGSRSASRLARQQGTQQLLHNHLKGVPPWRWPRWFWRNLIS